MSKVSAHPYQDGSNKCQYWFWCPGCDTHHAYTIPNWNFNGDVNKPTFTPSLLCNRHDEKSRCHLYVTDGKIKYLSDCHHKLANQTIDMEECEL
jgi:hypothetical protein